MSFVGSIPTKVRNIVAHIARDVEGQAVIPMAGNFAIASSLRSGGFTGSISCCDISLYTSALGCFLSGTKIDVQEKRDCPEHLQGLYDTTSELTKVSSLSLIYSLRDVWKLKNPYHERLFRQTILSWSMFMEKTIEKVVAYKEHLGDIKYTPMDAVEFLREVDKKNTVFAFPPTYKRGYEKMEQVLDAVFDWAPPEYTELTDKDLSLYDEIAKFSDYAVILEKDLPDVHAIIGQPCAVLPRGRAAFSHIVRKKKSSNIVYRSTIKSSPVGKIWSPQDKVTGMETPSVAILSLQQTIHLNELFLSSRINYFTGGVGLSVAFLLDEKCIGKADFCPSAHQWKLPEEKPMIYIMSDLAVPSVEKRLAKLVLMLMLSAEVKEMLDLKYIENFCYAATSAFSRGPVSMKYRGVFNLHTRKEQEQGFILNYFAEFTGDPIEASFEKWKKKYKK